jgi:hypothetical protein
LNKIQIHQPPDQVDLRDDGVDIDLPSRETPENKMVGLVTENGGPQ